MQPIIHKCKQWLVTKHIKNYHHEILKSVNKSNEINKNDKIKMLLMKMFKFKEIMININ